MKDLDKYMAAGIVVFVVLAIGIEVVAGTLQYCADNPNATCCRNDTMCYGSSVKDYCIEDCKEKVRTGELTACLCDGGM